MWKMESSVIANKLHLGRFYNQDRVRTFFQSEDKCLVPHVKHLDVSLHFFCSHITKQVTFKKLHCIQYKYDFMSVTTCLKRNLRDIFSYFWLFFEARVALDEFGVKSSASFKYFLSLSGKLISVAMFGIWNRN